MFDPLKFAECLEAGGFTWEQARTLTFALVDIMSPARQAARVDQAAEDEPSAFDRAMARAEGLPEGQEGRFVEAFEALTVLWRDRRKRLGNRHGGEM
ncbi:hypothetical protein [Rhodopila sp.]|uniref:hypothetical protein n=1 Tax=Rhodopila sp. TaxID=2480087 RepID=UPI003D0A60C9